MSDFIAKTYTMVNSCPSDVCCWSQLGDSFIIKDQSLFADMLPHFFKHKNFRSFVRQLNFYGFRKIRAEMALRPTRPPHWSEFRHENFRRNEPELLKIIKRTGTTEHIKATEGSELETLRQQVTAMQTQIDTLTGLVTQLVADRAHQIFTQPNMKRRRLATEVEEYNNVTDASEHKSSQKPLYIKAEAGAAPIQSQFAKEPVQQGQQAAMDPMALTSAGQMEPIMEQRAMDMEGVPLSQVGALRSFEILRDLLSSGSAGSGPAIEALERMGSDPLRLMSTLSIGEDDVRSILGTDYQSHTLTHGSSDGSLTSAIPSQQSIKSEGASPMSFNNQGTHEGNGVEDDSTGRIPPMVAAFALGAAGATDAFLYKKAPTGENVTHKHSHPVLNNHGHRLSQPDGTPPTISAVPRGPAMLPHMPPSSNHLEGMPLGRVESAHGSSLANL